MALVSRVWKHGKFLLFLGREAARSEITWKFCVECNVFLCFVHLHNSVSFWCIFGENSALRIKLKKVIKTWKKN